MYEKWFGAKISGPLGGTFSAAIAARAEERPRVQRREHAHDLVDPVRLARQRALVVPRRSAPPGAGPCRPAPSWRPARSALALLLGHAGSYPARPAARALDAPRQRREQRVALVVAHLRLVARPLAPQLARRGPASTAPAPTPASSAAPSAVVSAISGTTTGTPSTSAWNCISQRVGGRAAVGPQLGERLARRPPPSRGRRRPSGRRSPRAPRGPGARARAAGQPDDRPARVRVPVRRAEAGQRRARSRRRRCPSATPPAPRSRPPRSMIPRPSRSHCTAAPVTKIAASSA